MKPLFQSESERQQLRWRCMVDLKYLAVDICDYTKITDEMHGPVFDFYGSYDPRPKCLACGCLAIWVDDKKCICGSDRFEDQMDVWERQDHEISDGMKDDMQLDPRGTFKSTLVMCRCIQSIICFPDMTIAYISAASNLPGDFVNAIQQRFIQHKGQEPSKFQQLFPEFVLPASKYRDGYFTVPVRKRIDPLPTMTSTSIESSTSGIHPWLMVLDDLVDNRNTQNPAVIRKVNKSVALLMYTRMKWTHVCWRGTRYSPIDAYGERMKKNKRGQTGRVKLLVRSAWTPKPGKEDVPIGELTENDVILNFPTVLPWSELESKRDDSLELFCAQMLNDPLGAQHGTFDPVKTQEVVRPFIQMPATGQVVIAWRFPYEQGQYYAAGVVGIVDGFTLAIVDAVRGSFKPSRLAYKIVELAKKWACSNIRIENTPGAHSYEEAIKANAIAQGWKLDIEWVDFINDSVTRSSRVTRMEPLVNASRLIFATHIKIIDVLIEQLIQFGMTDERELPEALSLLIDKMPKLDAAGSHLTADSIEEYRSLKKQALHDKIYALGAYANIEPEAPYREPSGKPEGLDEIMPGLTG